MIAFLAPGHLLCVGINSGKLIIGFSGLILKASIDSLKRVQTILKDSSKQIDHLEFVVKERFILLETQFVAEFQQY